MDEDTLAHVKARAIHQIGPDRKMHFRQSCSGDEIDSLGHRQQARHGHHGKLGIAAASQQGTDLIADAPALYLRTKRDDMARNLETENG